METLTFILLRSRRSFDDSRFEILNLRPHVVNWASCSLGWIACIYATFKCYFRLRRFGVRQSCPYGLLPLCFAPIHWRVISQLFNCGVSYMRMKPRNLFRGDSHVSPASDFNPSLFFRMCPGLPGAPDAHSWASWSYWVVNNSSWNSKSASIEILTTDELRSTRIYRFWILDCGPALRRDWIWKTKQQKYSSSVSIRVHLWFPLPRSKIVLRSLVDAYI